MTPQPKVVCHCLHVTEEDILEALERWDIRTLRELMRRTDAGTGCMACHPALREYLARRRAALRPR